MISIKIDKETNKYTIEGDITFTASAPYFINDLMNVYREFTFSIPVEYLQDTIALDVEELAEKIKQDFIKYVNHTTF